MAYTDIDNPSDYFNIKLYTGNATNPTTISGIGFQPDWVWTKGRDTAEGHRLCDSVRGVTKDLLSNTTASESTNTIGLKSFNADGYVIGNSNGYNKNGNTFVSWNWLAGTAFSNDASSTSIGSLDSSGSVNDTAGFAIVKYVGNGSSGATIKHGLTSAPTFMIIRVYTATAGFQVYSKAVGATKFAGYLNTTEAAADAAGVVNNTDPGTSVFTVGNGGNTNNDGGTHIAYCFAEKQGFSKQGVYTGNGNNGDGPFIYTGFKPAWVLVTRLTAGENWLILDNKRDTFNPQDSSVYPNLANAEDADGADYFDFVSNGMKVKTNNGGTNTDGADYVYLAFAESPFVTSTGVPTTAR